MNTKSLGEVLDHLEAEREAIRARGGEEPDVVIPTLQEAVNAIRFVAQRTSSDEYVALREQQDEPDRVTPDELVTAIAYLVTIHDKIASR